MEIALQGLGCLQACCSQIGLPVYAHSTRKMGKIASRLTHEKDDRDIHCREKSVEIEEAKSMKLLHREEMGPRVENLDHINPCSNLSLQIVHRNIGDLVEEMRETGVRKPFLHRFEPSHEITCHRKGPPTK